MIALLKTLLTNKYLIGAVGVVAVLAAIWGYGLHRYHQGKADGAVEAQLAAAAQYRAQIDDLNRANTQLQVTVDTLKDEKPKIITKYRDKVVKVPLPADCRIDDERLRNIESALQSTSTSR